MYQSLTIPAVFLLLGAFVFPAVPVCAEAALKDNGDDIEYIVVLSEVAIWEDAIPSDKDMKIYFDVDKGMSYLFALYGEATAGIYTPYGLWAPSEITDPDVVAKVREDLPADGSYYMLPSIKDPGEYYMMLIKNERNKRAPFKIVQYTVYKFEKPAVDEEPPEDETGAPGGPPESTD
jgi:hypothetical protein